MGIVSDFTGQRGRRYYEEPDMNCILCGRPFTAGETGNELGFCIRCQNRKDFPYDLDAYYRDYDKGRVAFKGEETMARGILEPYRKNKRR